MVHWREGYCLPSQKKTEMCNNGVVAHTHLEISFLGFGGRTLLWIGCTFVFSELLIRRFVKDCLLLASGVEIITELQQNKLRRTINNSSEGGEGYNSKQLKKEMHSGSYTDT